MKTFLHILGAVGGIALVILGIIFARTPIVNGSSATSTSGLTASVALAGALTSPLAKGGLLPTSTAKTVSCNLSATLVTNADQSQQAKLTWTQTAGTIGYVPELDFYATTTSGTVLTPVLTAGQNFTFIDANGIATSTCQTSATPTSFAPAS